MVCIITISLTSPLFFCNGTRFYFWTFVKPFLQWFDALPENLKRNKCNLQANHQVSTVIKWQLSYNLLVDSITHTHTQIVIHLNKSGRIKDGHSSLVHHICCHFGTIPPNPPGFCPVFFQPPFIKTSMIVTKRRCCPVRRPRSTLAYLTSWWKRISTIAGPKGAQMIFSSKIGWGLFLSWWHPQRRKECLLRFEDVRSNQERYGSKDNEHPGRHGKTNTRWIHQLPLSQRTLGEEEPRPSLNLTKMSTDSRCEKCEFTQKALKERYLKWFSSGDKSLEEKESELPFC